MRSEFWLLMKTPQAQSSVDLYPGYQLPDICIVELTPDELSYIWPEAPYFGSEDVAEAQDPDYAIDGDWLSENGFFHSFEDFKKMNGFDSHHFHFLSLGVFASVREARSVLGGLRFGV